MPSALSHTRHANNARDSKDVDALKLYDASGNRWRTYRDRINPVAVAAVSFAKSIAESDVFDDDKLATLRGLHAATENLITLAQEVTERAEVAHDMRQRVCRSEMGADLGNDVEVYQQKLTNARETRLSVRDLDDGGYLPEIDDFIATLSGSGDADMLVSGRRPVASRCPVTGTALVHPVSNKECGHVYSTQGVIAYFCQKNGRRNVPKSIDQLPRFFEAACPNAGCQSIISPGNLARDFRTERSQRQALLSATDADDGEGLEVVDE